MTGGSSDEEKAVLPPFFSSDEDLDKRKIPFPSTSKNAETLADKGFLKI